MEPRLCRVARVPAACRLAEQQRAKGRRDPAVQLMATKRSRRVRLISYSRCKTAVLGERVVWS